MDHHTPKPPYTLRYNTPDGPVVTEGLRLRWDVAHRGAQIDQRGPDQAWDITVLDADGIDITGTFSFLI